MSLGPEAVAVACLFSYLDPSQERAIEAALPAGVFVSRSSEVLPERREYERGIATWVNAYTGPKIHGYLERLAGALADMRIAVLQSAGETLSAASASRRAVHLLLSGPAGGVSQSRSLLPGSGPYPEHTLNMFWQGSVGRALDAFHQAHERRYGHRLGTPVELVNLRVALRGPTARPSLARPPSGRPASPTRWITVYGVAAPVPVFERGALTAGQGLSAPAIIRDPGSTTYLARGWQATVDDHGYLRLRDSAGVC